MAPVMLVNFFELATNSQAIVSLSLLDRAGAELLMTGKYERAGPAGHDKNIAEHRLWLLLYRCLNKGCEGWMDSGCSHGAGFTSSLRVFLSQRPPWPQIKLMLYNVKQIHG